MNYSTLLTLIGGAIAIASAVLKGASWLAGAWKLKAKAIAEAAVADALRAKAEAEAASELRELRASLAKEMARMQAVEDRLKNIENRDAIRAELSGAVQR